MSQTRNISLLQANFINGIFYTVYLNYERPLIKFNTFAVTLREVDFSKAIWFTVLLDKVINFRNVRVNCCTKRHYSGLGSIRNTIQFRSGPFFQTITSTLSTTPFPLRIYLSSSRFLPQQHFSKFPSLYTIFYYIVLTLTGLHTQNQTN